MRATWIAAASLLAFAGACSDGPCDALDGVYRVRFIQESGTCGSSEWIERYRGGTAASSAESNITCRWNRSVTDDGCYVEADGRCDDPDNGLRARYVITLESSSDGDKVDGHMTVTITRLSTGMVECQSTGRVTYRRP
jgi:hypothetical protein